MAAMVNGVSRRVLAPPPPPLPQANVMRDFGSRIDKIEPKQKNTQTIAVRKQNI